MVAGMLAAMLVASWIYWLVTSWSLRTFSRSQPALPSGFTPPVSILKAVKGADFQAYDNFVSFCRQDYPDYEVLFGVADPADAAIQIVEQVRRAFPHRCIRLLIAPPSGTNRKASLLHALAGAARHDVLVASDSDMRVAPDYLKRVVAPLADRRVGLVTCLFRGEAPLTLTARLEALYMGATFLPSAVLARTLFGLPVAFGSTVAIRRGDLVRLGGFSALSNYLVDDYQLGARVASLGLTVHLSDYLVSCALGPTTFREQWDRMVRWMHCSRVSRPREYPGILLTFSTVLASVLVLATGCAPLAWLALAFSLGLRWLVGWLVTGYTLSRAARRWLIWLPVTDLLTTLTWCAGLVGRRVVWRGEHFLLEPGGRLIPASRALPPVAEAEFDWRRPIRWLDGVVRDYSQIQPFSDSAECLLRLAVGASPADLALSDGTRIRRGEPIGELHFWNEHIPPFPRHGSSLPWALAFRRRLAFSFRELAAAVQRNPRLQVLRAFRGEGILGSRYDMAHLNKMADRWGFDLVHRRRTGVWRRFSDAWVKLYAVVLLWAFNPSRVKGTALNSLRWNEYWMSREVLLRRYGAMQAAPDRVADGAEDARELAHAGWHTALHPSSPQ